MTRPSPYLILEVRVSFEALHRESFLGATRDAREQHLKDYLETLGLRPTPWLWDTSMLGRF